MYLAQPTDTKFISYVLVTFRYFTIFDDFPTSIKEMKKPLET